MKVTIGVAAGTGKTECEDCAFFNDRLAEEDIREYEDERMRCLGVADGVGGNAGGRDAGRFVASQIIRGDFSDMTESGIREFAAALNEELIRAASGIPEKTEMATTLSCVFAASDGFYLIHAGNTRIYVMQGAYLKQLTTDHTTRNWLMERGQYEAAEQCNKNEINCCFGGGNPRYADQLVVQKLFEETVPDTILLTSDGVHEYVDIDDMEAVLAASASDRDRIRLLIEKAAANGSADDKTVILVRR